MNDQNIKSNRKFQGKSGRINFFASVCKKAATATNKDALLSKNIEVKSLRLIEEYLIAIIAYRRKIDNTDIICSIIEIRK